MPIDPKAGKVISVSLPLDVLEDLSWIQEIAGEPSRSHLITELVRWLMNPADTRLSDNCNRTFCQILNEGLEAAENGQTLKPHSKKKD